LCQWGLPCSVLLCRRPQFEYFQWSVGDFAPSFAHASCTSQVQNVCFCRYHMHFISFTMPAITAESARMQKLHLCTFAYSFCAMPSFYLCQPYQLTAQKCTFAFLHVRLAPTTPPFLCPCQPYQPRVQKCKCTFTYSACASHHILALPMPAIPEKVEKCKVCVLACFSIFAILHCQLCQLSQLKMQKCKTAALHFCIFGWGQPGELCQPWQPKMEKCKLACPHMKLCKKCMRTNVKLYYCMCMFM